jgi:hypothetical protein
MDRKELMAMFNKRPRIGTLSTADMNGNVNVAVFGSPQMVDEETVVMGIGKNRSLKNLKENPRAAFIVMEPGETVADWSGARVYLEAQTVDQEGEFYEDIKANIAKMAGQEAAGMIFAGIRFKITEVRPILDMSA